jgi:GDP-L-fucose synthase
MVGAGVEVTFDPTKPDGTPREPMDVSRLFATGWRPRYTLRGGLEETMPGFSKTSKKGTSA